MAWILEKFWAWTDCGGHPENVLTRDELLDNLVDRCWIPLPSILVSPGQLVASSVLSRGSPDLPEACAHLTHEHFRLRLGVCSRLCGYLKMAGDPAHCVNAQPGRPALSCSLARSPNRSVTPLRRADSTASAAPALDGIG
jgi:hypothetical protein